AHRLHSARARRFRSAEALRRAGISRRRAGPLAIRGEGWNAIPDGVRGSPSRPRPRSRPLNARATPPGAESGEVTAAASARLRLLAAAALFSTGGAAIKATHLSGWQVACFRSAVAVPALLLLVPRA